MFNPKREISKSSIILPELDIITQIDGILLDTDYKVNTLIPNKFNSEGLSYYER